MSKKVISEFDEVRISSVLGEGAVIEGNLNSPDSLRIGGTVNGDICTESIAVIDEKGVINGNITAVSILIAGVVHGNANSQNKTEITATGRIYGDITTHTLSIDENAVFVGQCNMNRDADEED